MSDLSTLSSAWAMETLYSCLSKQRVFAGPDGVSAELESKLMHFSRKFFFFVVQLGIAFDLDIRPYRGLVVWHSLPNLRVFQLNKECLSYRKALCRSSSVIMTSSSTCSLSGSSWCRGVHLQDSLGRTGLGYRDTWIFCQDLAMWVLKL